MELKLDKKGFGMIEYTVLIVIVMVALYFMRGQIQGAFFGRWKTAGDSFGVGRQYDPGRTNECSYFNDFDTNTGIATGDGFWYDQRCFENIRSRCAVGDTVCEKKLIKDNCVQGTACVKETGI